jgi:dihydrofolate reductase
MTSINIIVAASDNNAIGRDNKLLWHLPTDMKFFKAITWTHPVIMGRKTFESLGGKLLPGRKNIIISRNKDYRAPAEAWFATSLDEAIKKAKTTNSKEIFIAGGGEIYQQSMQIADRIYMTRVHTQIEADTFFPEIDEKEWKKVSATDYAADDKHAFSFSIEVWEKKK